MNNKPKSKTSKRPSTPEQRYATIFKTLCRNPAVSLGTSGKKGFGSPALSVSGKIFAFLSSKEQFVVKLPRPRVDALVTAGVGERFDLGHGRIMKEWLSVEPEFDQDWLPLAREALEFVASKHSASKSI
jgi:hypothetical protein